MSEYGTSPVEVLTQAFADKTDEEMMALYAKTHPEEENGMDAKIFDLKQLKTAVTVPLLDATHLYQPVNGTSNGSRYFVLALGERIRVAGRWQKSGKFAIRIEGEGVKDQDNHAMFEEIGLDQKSNTHWSIHLDASSDVAARKAVGAVLLGLSTEWHTGVPNPHVIQGI